MCRPHDWKPSLSNGSSETFEMLGITWKIHTMVPESKRFKSNLENYTEAYKMVFRKPARGPEKLQFANALRRRPLDGGFEVDYTAKHRFPRFSPEPIPKAEFRAMNRLA